jgi:hypothetical protein
MLWGLTKVEVGMRREERGSWSFHLLSNSVSVLIIYVKGAKGTL